MRNCWEGNARMNLHVKKVLNIPTLHGAHADTLVLFEQAPYGVVERAIHAPLAIKRVGFTLGT